MTASWGSARSTFSKFLAFREIILLNLLWGVLLRFLKNGVSHRCACVKLSTNRGYRTILGDCWPPLKVSRDTGYRSDSIAISRDMGPLSPLPCPSFLYFFDKGKESHKRTRIFIPTEPLKSLEKKRKRSKKTRKSLQGERIKRELPQKKNKERKHSARRNDCPWYVWGRCCDGMWSCKWIKTVTSWSTYHLFPMFYLLA